MRGVEHVDVDGEIQRVLAHPRADALGDRGHALGLQLVAVHHPEPERRVAGQVVAAVERPADADVHRGVVAEQPLLGGAAKRGAVGVGRAEVGIPGIEVRVEVHQRHRPEAAVDRAQQRKGDGVIAAQADDAAHLLEQAGGGGLHLADGLGDVERVAGDIPRVGDLLLDGTAPSPYAGWNCVLR